MTTRMVQVRDVPSGVVDVLKSRAAAQGTSLSEYLRAEIERMAAEPTMHEVLERLRSRPRRHLDVDIADVVREVRDEYDST